MAAVAILPEPAAMDILPFVAVNALAAQLRRIAGAHMAGRTDQSFVLAGKRKVGLRVMIERPDLPVDRVVTTAAGSRRAQRALMVAVLMAGVAAYPFGGKGLVCMAACTGDLGVLAQQREARQGVIETDAGFPVTAVVTLPAGSAELAGMGIVLRVAAGTLH